MVAGLVTECEDVDTNVEPGPGVENTLCKGSSSSCQKGLACAWTNYDKMQRQEPEILNSDAFVAKARHMASSYGYKTSTVFRFKNWMAVTDEEWARSMDKLTSGARSHYSTCEKLDKCNSTEAARKFWGNDYAPGLFYECDNEGKEMIGDRCDNSDDCY